MLKDSVNPWGDARVFERNKCSMSAPHDKKGSYFYVFLDLFLALIYERQQLMLAGVNLLFRLSSCESVDFDNGTGAKID